MTMEELSRGAVAAVAGDGSGRGSNSIMRLGQWRRWLGNSGGKGVAAASGCRGGGGKGVAAADGDQQQQQHAPGAARKQQEHHGTESMVRLLDNYG
ncbi:hypothetical protein OsJ_01927 [Oryza sativa Japonica Group]|uniref:Uncharacterized protein n=3 Tax=Oryza TaxID=4527 RepID=B9EX38_ORYSJ|nr:hypothetical protein OsJ_01927 [Oryza sativa Japonica Group]